jgi:hypothetical protein
MFKVGDMVKSNFVSNYGMIGTVEKILDDKTYLIKWSDGKTHGSNNRFNRVYLDPTSPLEQLL